MDILSINLNTIYPLKTEETGTMWANTVRPYNGMTRGQAWKPDPTGVNS
jgi:hypothetical protein